MKLRRHAGAGPIGPVLIALWVTLPWAIGGTYGCAAVDFLRRDPSEPRDRASRFDRFVGEVTLNLRDTAPLIERLRVGESSFGSAKPTWDQDRREAIRRDILWKALQRLTRDFEAGKLSGQRAVTSRVLELDLRRELQLGADESVDRTSERALELEQRSAGASRRAVQSLAATPWSGLMVEMPAVLLAEQTRATTEDLQAWEAAIEELTDEASFLSASPAALASIEDYAFPPIVLGAAIEFVADLTSSAGAGGARDPFFGPLLEAEEALGPKISKRASTRSKRRGLQRRLKTELDRLLETLAELRDQMPVQPFTGSDALNPEPSAAWSQRIRDAAGPSSDPAALSDVGRAEARRLKRSLGSLLDLDPRAPGFEGLLREKFAAIRARDLDPPGSREPERTPETLWQNLEPQLEAIAAGCPTVLVESRTARAFERPYGRWSPFVRGNLTPPGDPRVRPSIFLASRDRDPTAPAWLREAEALRYGVPGCAVADAFRRAARTEVPRYLLAAERDAFVEGWGLYALSSAAEDGLLLELDSGFGRLSQELIAFVTLVTDIGLNAGGWTLQQAATYLTENTPLPASAAKLIVTRISADPGRPALPAIGLLRLRSLRRGVEALIGEDFDVAEFHGAVLAGGPIPMSELDARVEVWLAQRGSQGGE